MGLKLNLGSGQNPRPGYVNVDKHGDPDLKCDLESFPWPWPDSSVSEILLIHVLEQLGATHGLMVRGPLPTPPILRVPLVILWIAVLVWVARPPQDSTGASPDVFIRIMKEMYRVCEPAAQIYIVVPHPRHDNFIGDPTHVRPVTPAMMQLFSKKANLRWREIGSPSSPLALYHGVNFESAEEAVYMLEEPYASDARSGKIGNEEIGELLKKLNNVASEIHIRLKVVKD